MTRRLLDLRWVARWVGRHRRWVGFWLVLAAGSELTGAGPAAAFLSLGLGPGIVCLVWHAAAPIVYEQYFAGPFRRVGWCLRTRLRWTNTAERCRLTDRIPRISGTRHGRKVEYKTVAPRLQRVRAHGHCLELTIRTRPGQTVEELDDAAPRLASTLGAVSFRTRPTTGTELGSTTVVELVMADALTTVFDAAEPQPQVEFDGVRLGRSQGGGDWRLPLRGRHTLIAGCSGSGKGSVLWGICCGLAPAVRADLVRLWGVDLKRGVELEMGSGLFSAHAYKPVEAVDALKTLMTVIDERGSKMAGVTRLHQPTAGEPLHVLVIDELAALTAYADVSIRREAERLLSEILTQGRALGVVVVACVQDPRKDVVTMRGLFTQTVALRLRSSEETMMVLGGGMTRIAPAHRISPTYPGTAWVVEDTGAADRVRADYWPDDLIRHVSTSCATTVKHEPPPGERYPIAEDMPAPRPRKPRSPRKPRIPAEGAA